MRCCTRSNQPCPARRSRTCTSRRKLSGSWLSKSAGFRTRAATIATAKAAQKIRTIAGSEGSRAAARRGTVRQSVGFGFHVRPEDFLDGGSRPALAEKDERRVPASRILPAVNRSRVRPALALTFADQTHERDCDRGRLQDRRAHSLPQSGRDDRRDRRAASARRCPRRASSSSTTIPPTTRRARRRAKARASIARRAKARATSSGACSPTSTPTSTCSPTATAATIRPTRPRSSTRSSPSTSTWWSARGAAAPATQTHEHFGERAFDWLYRRFFAGASSDIVSGYRAFTRRFVKSFPAISTGFDIEVELSMHANQLMIPVAEIELSDGKPQRALPANPVGVGDAARVARHLGMLVKETGPSRSTRSSP